MGPFNETSLDSITRDDFWRFQFRFNSLAGEPSIPLSQDEAKSLQVMCLVQDDPKKQEQIAMALAALTSYSDEKKKSVTLDKILLGLAAGAKEEDLAICGISVSSLQNKDKVPLPPATTLIAPPENLWRGIITEIDAPGATAQTIRICSFHDRWFKGVKLMLPIRAESLISDTWTQNGGWLAPEAEQNQFNTMFELCRESLSIVYDPSAGQYIVYHNPEAYCTKALELAARGNPAPTPEMHDIFTRDSLLNMKWTGWAARQSFCGPIAEKGPWARSKVMASIYTAEAVAGFVAGVTALAGLTRVVVKVFFIEAAARLTFLELFKIMVNPARWLRAVKNAWDYIRGKWGNRRGPKGGGAKPTNAGDGKAAKPAGDAVSKRAKDAEGKSPKMVDSNFAPIPIFFFEWAPKAAALSAAKVFGTAAGLMTPVPPSVIDAAARRFSNNPRHKVPDSL